MTGERPDRAQVAQYGQNHMGIKSMPTLGHAYRERRLFRPIQVVYLRVDDQ